ncbi:protein NUCLEAR FUSION DEFECTIVE 6, chloroplastic/mitochondrial isoform X4 [Quillaja saponaria]|uniref:Protein NUCLEAR FUSION DEFECTIVE 6, chloroplastic/mitochondrial isoform X4 n=1 Tax=Quillaja saponaria TaxID=32244 RepID=A0AAD7L572_QUISA|nr:protein NUCLEAR FUSION DEFECTIVE 6, chloroplastic/mitochondrial isoform X4 [Quillaja saponaria]
MASRTCSRLICNFSLPSLKSAAKPNRGTPFLKSATTTSSQRSSSSTRPAFTVRRFPSFTRNRVSELGCVQSLFPLHSAVATARMMSCLSMDSRNCRALWQDGVDGT